MLPNPDGPGSDTIHSGSRPASGNLREKLLRMPRNRAARPLVIRTGR